MVKDLNKLSDAYVCRMGTVHCPCAWSTSGGGCVDNRTDLGSAEFLPTHRSHL